MISCGKVVSYFLTIIPFFIPRFTILIHFSYISMCYSFMNLSINERALIMSNKSPKSMWFTVFINHPIIVIFCLPTLNINIAKNFNRDISLIKIYFTRIFIPFINIKFAYFLPSFWLIIWYVRIFIKYFLDFLLQINLSIYKNFIKNFFNLSQLDQFYLFFWRFIIVFFTID